MRRMAAKVADIVLPPGRRLLMVSDIHGNLPFLRGLLEKVRFCADDTLFLLGDMLEKGKQSLETLHFIMALGETRDVHCVCGNCDDLLLEFVDGGSAGDGFFLPYLSQRPESTMRQMGAECGLAEVSSAADLAALRVALKQHFQPELEFLRSLPTVIRSERLLLVHGGVEDEEHPERLDGWHCMKNDDFLSRGMAFRRTCVVGHWPVTLYDPEKPSAKPLYHKEGNIWSIDGGCVLKLDGQLNALIFDGEDDAAPRWAAYDGLPSAVALDGQEESETSVNIRWGMSEVEVLERGTERSLCRHARTGRELLILNEYLYTGRDGLTHCEDSTDYRPAVAPGDKVKVVAAVEGDTLIKRDGVTGWYGGRLAMEDKT